MAHRVTVNIFDVEWSNRFPNLEEVILEYHGLPLERRWRDDIRLDRVIEERVDGRAVFKLDFAKKREVGPGIVDDAGPVRGVRMRDGQNFGEETAALYIPRRRWLVVLNNHFGIGPNRMMAYFNALDPGDADRHFDYSVLPKLDAQAMAKLQRMRNITSVEVTATLDALTASGHGSGVALARATDGLGARRVKFELLANEAYKKGNTLRTQDAKQLVRSLRDVEVDGVTALRLKGEDPHDERDTMIDLIKQRLRKSYPADDLDVEFRRYTIDSRWRMLIRAYRSWNDAL